MDYEKAYKKALERARIWKDKSGMPKDKQGILDDIFPELKESEDENIRKALICGMYALKEQHKTWFASIPIDNAIAWLKKQKTSEEAMQYLKKNHSSSEMSDFQAAMNIAVAKAYDKGYNDGLEKQGENSVCKVKIGETYKCIASPRYTCFRTGDIYHVEDNFVAELINTCSECFVLLEKQGEQKPADKVEPKFHEGEWVIWKDKCYKVNYNGCGYELVDQDGLSTSLEYGTIDENAHLWDVTTDAKDGDVLYTPKGLGVEGIFLVSGWKQIEGTGKTLCSNIGYRVDDDEIVEGGIGAIWWEGVKDPFFPATKEQRDLLFQKMHEAGYEWDAEKKELKKIEQNLAWSEEDETTLGWLCTFLNIYGHEFYEGNEENVINWLKSLKQRIKRIKL